MKSLYFWLGAEAEAVAAQYVTDAQRAIESVPVIDLTGAESDE